MRRWAPAEVTPQYRYRMTANRRPTHVRTHPRAGSQLLVTALLAVVGLVGLGPVRPAAAASPVPAGYRLVASEPLGPGVEHQTLRQDQPPQDVHVARLAPGQAGRLLPVVANDVVSGSSGAEPTSSMCVRVKCAAAVNGDFFDGRGRPIGAMVAGGELLTTPEAPHILLRVDGRGQPTLRPGIDWGAGVTTADGRTVGIPAVNRPLSGEGIILYSRRWGPSTATPADGGTVEVAFRLPSSATAALPSGSSAVAVGPAVVGGNQPIPAGHVVLSGRGAGARALVDLAQRAGGAAALNVSAGGIVSAIGGSPQLLQNRRSNYPTNNPDSFTQERHARTVVGITSSGEMLLVTADARGASSGLTLAEATQLLSGLGAVDALNLDGGTSTTFVGAGSVRNAPSGGAERGVASALTIVPVAAPPDPVTALLTHVTESLNSLLQPR